MFTGWIYIHVNENNKNNKRLEDFKGQNKPGFRLRIYVNYLSFYFVLLLLSCTDGCAV